MNKEPSLKNSAADFMNCFLMAFVLLTFAGCATFSQPEDITVRAGMSSGVLTRLFGEPVRVQPGADGGADWYYRFVVLNANPTSESGISAGTGGVSSYTSQSVQLSDGTQEQPIHVSSTGYVIEPLPTGKIVRNSR